MRDCTGDQLRCHGCKAQGHILKDCPALVTLGLLFGHSCWDERRDFSGDSFYSPSVASYIRPNSENLETVQDRIVRSDPGPRLPCISSSMEQIGHKEGTGFDVEQSGSDIRYPIVPYSLIPPALSSLCLHHGPEP